MQKHSPAEPERSRGLRKDARCRSIAQRSPKGAEDSERTHRAQLERRKGAERSTGHRKDVRARETPESPVIAGGLDGPLSLYGDRFGHAAPGRR